MSIATTQTIADRIDDLDWAALTAKLEEDGSVQTPPILSGAECRALGASFEDGRFRSTIDMRRYRFGEGEYKYFDAPLPEPIERARHGPYPPLAAVANRWAERLGRPAEFPSDLDAFLDRCHRAGQRRTSPLLLRYVEGGPH